MPPQLSSSSCTHVTLYIRVHLYIYCTPALTLYIVYTCVYPVYSVPVFTLYIVYTCVYPVYSVPVFTLYIVYTCVYPYIVYTCMCLPCIYTCIHPVYIVTVYTCYIVYTCVYPVYSIADQLVESSWPSHILQAPNHTPTIDMVEHAYFYDTLWVRSMRLNAGKIIYAAQSTTMNFTCSREHTVHRYTPFIPCYRCYDHLCVRLLTLSAHAQRVTVVVDSVCLSVCLSVCNA